MHYQHYQIHRLIAQDEHRQARRRGHSRRLRRLARARRLVERSQRRLREAEGTVRAAGAD